MPSSWMIRRSTGSCKVSSNSKWSGGGTGSRKSWRFKQNGTETGGSVTHRVSPLFTVMHLARRPPALALAATNREATARSTRAAQEAGRVGDSVKWYSNWSPPDTGCHSVFTHRVYQARQLLVSRHGTPLLRRQGEGHRKAGEGTGFETRTNWSQRHTEGDIYLFTHKLHLAKQPPALAQQNTKKGQEQRHKEAGEGWG